MTAKKRSNPEPEAIAIAGLSFIAGDPDQMSRFVALSGIDPGDLRVAADQPGFLAGVLDFFMGHEPTLIAFAENSGIEPEQIAAARHRLAGEHGFE